MADRVGTAHVHRLGQPGIASGRLLFAVGRKGDFPRGGFTLRRSVGHGISQDIQASCFSLRSDLPASNFKIPASSPES